MSQKDLDKARSKKKYHRYKRYYYAYLANNANAQGKGGQAIFYAEKVNEELKE